MLKGCQARGRSIMTNGIYYTIFKSYLGIIGDGLMVVDNGKVHGGDSRYLYRGLTKLMEHL
jgi:hypothetical protein